MDDVAAPLLVPMPKAAPPNQPVSWAPIMLATPKAMPKAMPAIPEVDPSWHKGQTYACPICHAEMTAALVEHHAATCPKARGHAHHEPDLSWAEAMSPHTDKPAVPQNQDIMWLMSRPKTAPLKRYKFLRPMEYWVGEAEAEWKQTLPTWDGHVVLEMLKGPQAKNFLERMMREDNVSREYAISLMFFEHYNPVTGSQTGLDNLFTFQSKEFQ